jgi:hypothetical protein
MKTWLAVAVAAAALSAVEAQAQTQDQRWGGGWGQVPSGSYQQSCRDVRVSGSGPAATLTASCQDPRGRWNYSSVRLNQCRGEIINWSGRLTCAPGGGPGWGGNLPRGSYQQSCRDVRVSGPTLSASCRDNRGRWNYSSIRFNDCRSGVGNNNGRLACEGGGGGRPPGGGGRSELTLFSATDFQGQPFSTGSEVTNLPRQYNDRALSLRIQGRGSWQICADSDFRGRCQIVDRDVRDLRQYGLGEAISSMRPVRGR